MKAEQQENDRYSQEDFCHINMEEELMFSLLARYTGSRKVAPDQISLLDIGCGSGRIAHILLQKGYKVFGIDFSETALARARKRGLDVKRANLDEGIPEPDHSYDVVWAGDIIEHVFDPIGLLKDVQRVLKPGGVLIFSIPSDVGIVSRFKMLIGYSYQEEMYRRSGFYKHHTFFNLRLITFMLRKAKLSPVKVEKVLIGRKKKRHHVNILPSAFYNELVIMAKKDGV